MQTDDLGAFRARLDELEREDARRVEAEVTRLRREAQFEAAVASYVARWLRSTDDENERLAMSATLDRIARDRLLARETGLFDERGHFTVVEFRNAYQRILMDLARD